MANGKVITGYSRDLTRMRSVALFGNDQPG